LFGNLVLDSPLKCIGFNPTNAAHSSKLNQVLISETAIFLLNTLGFTEGSCKVEVVSCAFY